MRPLSSLPTRLQFLLLASLVAVPMLGLLTWSGLHLRAEALDRARVQSQRLADGLAGQHETVMAGMQQLFVALSRLPQVRAHDPAVQPLLAELLRQAPHYLNIFLVDRAGVVWSSAVGPYGHRSDDRPYFRRATETGRLAVGEYAVSRSTGQPTLQFAYPYRDATGEVAGVVGVALALSSYDEVLERHPVPPGASWLLVDRGGIILSRSAERERWQGKPFTPATFAAMQAAGDTGTTVAMTMVGDERVVAWRKIRLPGEEEPYLYFRVGLPVATVLEAANQELRRNLGLALLFLLPSVALVVLAGKRWLVDRLGLLEAASARMAAGDLGVRVAGQVAGGELGRLAQAFDRMAEQLEARAQALAQSERSYREILDGTPDAVVVIDPSDGRLLDANQGAERHFGWPRAALLEAGIGALTAEEPACTEAAWRRRLDAAVAEGPQAFEWACRRRDGGRFWADVRLRAATIGGQARVVAAVQDVSARRAAEAEAARLQAQLVQAQKLELVGRLAGGVAHDINNTLAVIVGEAELLRGDLPPGHPGLVSAAEIERAAARSRDITRQLLAFSRKQVIAPRPVDLGAHLQAARSTLARLAGQDLMLALRLAPDAWAVRIDPAQVDQVLMNLVVNARDAMPEGGTIRVEVTNAPLDEAAARAFDGGRAGEFVRLRVADQGTGMDPATLARAFEPFFTTKGVHQGTGLGLATVHGIAAQNGGFVAAASAPGQGATIDVYLPRSPEAPAAEPVQAAAARAGAGDVLLVEDDEAVRVTTQRMLESLGYRVVPAASPEAALAAAGDPALRLDLLLTDVVMPGMRGPELRRRLGALRPGLPAVYMSGHAPDDRLAAEAAAGQALFLQKPFGRAALADRVQQALRR